MPRLPEGVTWPMVAVFLAVVVSGTWVAKQFQERQRLVANLQSHAASHPEHAAVTEVLVECNRRIVVDVQACSDQLLARFGPGVIDQMAALAAAGAFGK